MRNNRGINGTKDNPQDLPQEVLTELYNHFSEKAIRFPQLPSTLSQKESSSTADHTVIKCAHIYPGTACPARPSVSLPMVWSVHLDDPDTSTSCWMSGLSDLQDDSTARLHTAMAESGNNWLLSAARRHGTALTRVRGRAERFSAPFREPLLRGCFCRAHHAAGARKRWDPLSFVCCR